MAVIPENNVLLLQCIYALKKTLIVAMKRTPRRQQLQKKIIGLKKTFTCS